MASCSALAAIALHAALVGRPVLAIYGACIFSFVSEEHYTIGSFSFSGSLEVLIDKGVSIRTSPSWCLVLTFRKPPGLADCQGSVRGTAGQAQGPHPTAHCPYMSGGPLPLR